MKRYKKMFPENDNSLFRFSILSRRIKIPIYNVNENIITTMEKYIKINFEQKCHIEGYIEKDSSEVLTVSGGNVSGSDVIYMVIFQCKICNPSEGMVLNCIVGSSFHKSVRAFISSSMENAKDIQQNFIVAFIALPESEEELKVDLPSNGDEIKVKVIASRFELNDTFITVIGEYI